MKYPFQFNEINDRIGARQTAMTTAINSCQGRSSLAWDDHSPLRRPSRYHLTPAPLCPKIDCIRYRFGATAIYLTSLNRSDA